MNNEDALLLSKLDENTSYFTLFKTDFNKVDDDTVHKLSKFYNQNPFPYAAIVTSALYSPWILLLVLLPNWVTILFVVLFGIIYVPVLLYSLLITLIYYKLPRKRLILATYQDRFDVGILSLYEINHQNNKGVRIEDAFGNFVLMIEMPTSSVTEYYRFPFCFKTLDSAISFRDELLNMTSQLDSVELFKEIMLLYGKGELWKLYNNYKHETQNV
jgi:hypothetical protein